MRTVAQAAATAVVTAHHHPHHQVSPAQHRKAYNIRVSLKQKQISVVIGQSVNLIADCNKVTVVTCITCYVGRHKALGRMSISD